MEELEVGNWGTSSSFRCEDDGGPTKKRERRRRKWSGPSACGAVSPPIGYSSGFLGWMAGETTRKSCGYCV